jgi:ferredoxin
MLCTVRAACFVYRYVLTRRSHQILRPAGLRLEDLCQGCGICVSSCPAQAIEGRHFTSEDLIAEIKGLVIEDRHEAFAGLYKSFTRGVIIRQGVRRVVVTGDLDAAGTTVVKDGGALRWL